MRPPKYKKRYAKELIRRAKLGNCSISSICRDMKLGRSTLYNWAAVYPEMKYALEYAQTVIKADSDVVILAAGRGDPQYQKVDAAKLKLAHEVASGTDGKEDAKTIQVQNLQINNMNYDTLRTELEATLANLAKHAGSIDTAKLKELGLFTDADRQTETRNKSTILIKRD